MKAKGQDIGWQIGSMSRHPNYNEFDKDDSTYWLPLMLAYKHKIATLDQHLRQRQKQTIKADNDLKDQLDHQTRLLQQISDKHAEADRMFRSVDGATADYNTMGMLYLT